MSCSTSRHPCLTSDVKARLTVSADQNGNCFTHDS
uniref:Uncharacterized protein n=1 Tax=Siphoviridae sp. ctsYA13 TaxID=2825695 RepID=A0A8S5VBR3_9CAUD|nr:MAG TPA: hypothetical protein [Siphoviridae sp. ctsYA13]